MTIPMNNHMTHTLASSARRPSLENKLRFKQKLSVRHVSNPQWTCRTIARQGGREEGGVRMPLSRLLPRRISPHAYSACAPVDINKKKPPWRTAAAGCGETPLVRNKIDHRDEGISVLGRPGSDLLSQVLRLSTIGAGEFYGRVRDGIGYRLPAKTTRPAKDGSQWSVIREIPARTSRSKLILSAEHPRSDYRPPITVPDGH